MNEFAPLLPLLIPSFSSKGNLFLTTKDGKCVSDNYSLLQALDIKVSKTYLVSSYDIYYGFMPNDPNELPNTDYLFIDSGGYEINDGFDLSERNKFNYNILPWDVVKMRAVYQRICTCEKFQNTKIILSGYDGQGSLHKQLNEIQLLESEFPNAVINYIIKIGCPIDDLLNEIRLEQMHICNTSVLGFPEKELGHTVRERLQNLIIIKKCLLDCGWSGNIHLLGGLEPNLIKLYYFAGADIFDGLSWQRIRYRSNSTLFAPDVFFISLSEYENKYLMMSDNLAVLNDITGDLSILSNKRYENMRILESSLKSDESSINDILLLLEV